MKATNLVISNTSAPVMSQHDEVKGFFIVVNTFLKDSAGYLNRSPREIRQDSFSKRCFRMGGIYLSVIIF